MLANGRKGHNKLAEEVLEEIGLDSVYSEYCNKMTPSLFLTFCGYVLVDENEKYYDSDKKEFIKYTVAIFCSVSIGKDYAEYVKSRYAGEGNLVEDVCESSDIGKEMINQIIKRIREIKEKQKTIEDEER